MNKSVAPPTSRSRQSWLVVLLVPLLVIVVVTLSVETSSMLGAVRSRLSWSFRFTNVLSPAEAVPDEDLLHLSLLHEVCMENKNVSLRWQYGSPGHQMPGTKANNSFELMHPSDPDLLQKLRQCPDVDVFLPVEQHTNAYCEDAAAYVKYLKSRLLPVWALQLKFHDPDLGREVDYFDLCPNTPMLFFDHHWEDLPTSKRWPKSKPVYMMPNIEMVELNANHFWGVDVVLCKTNACYDRVTQWYTQEGNPRNTTVFYTKHTSSDQALFARKRLGEYAVAAKNFFDVKFLHTAGTSSHKGTREILECWTYTEGLPPIDVYIDRKPFYRLFPASYKMKIKRSLSPVRIHLGLVGGMDVSKLTAEAAFFVNPSYSEGYGHYINQARASGGLIITTDMAPMNELITGNETGLLIPVEAHKHPMVMLGGKYRGDYGLKGVSGLVGAFESSNVCHAIKTVMQSTTPLERATMGFNAKRQYHADTKYFAKAMQEVLRFANNTNSTG